MVIIVDSREKKPFTFGDKIETRVEALQTGDYSVLGLETVAVVERKSFNDLIYSLTSSRDRFENEIERLRGIARSGMASIVCEGLMSDVLAGNYESKVTPLALYGSIMGINAYGITVIMSGSRQAAERDTYTLLRIAYNREQYKLRKFLKGKIIKAG